MKKVFLVLFLALLCIGCNSDDDNSLCVPPPNYKVVNIVDKTTGENVFSNETFTKNQLQIISNPSNLFPFTFNDDLGNDVFTIVPINTNTTVQFSIVLNNEINIPLTAEIIVDNSCGTVYYFERIISDDPSFVIENGQDILVIKI